MIALITKGLPTIKRLEAKGLFVGRLYTPRHYNSLRATNEAGIAWAADNDGFQGVDERAFMQMLSALEPDENCLFVTCPDVVGDALATRKLWHKWHELISDMGFPPAYVLQDGLMGAGVPWNQCAAIFIGGTTEFKMGDLVRRTVAEAKERGKWVHMGRVNSQQRLRYANSIGVDSIDGTSWARWTDTHAEKLRSLPFQQARFARIESEER